MGPARPPASRLGVGRRGGRAWAWPAPGSPGPASPGRRPPAPAGRAAAAAPVGGVGAAWSSRRRAPPARPSPPAAPPRRAARGCAGRCTRRRPRRGRPARAWPPPTWPRTPVAAPKISSGPSFIWTTQPLRPLLASTFSSRGVSAAGAPPATRTASSVLPGVRRLSGTVARADLDRGQRLLDGQRGQHRPVAGHRDAARARHQQRRRAVLDHARCACLRGSPVSIRTELDDGEALGHGVDGGPVHVQRGRLPRRVLERRAGLGRRPCRSGR